MKLCEARIPCPIVDRYERHKMVEDIMRIDADDHSVRKYTWTPDEDSIRVRNVMDENELWREVEIPKPGTLLRITLDTHLRGDFRDSNEPGKRRRLPSNTDYIANLNWIEWLATAKLGIKLRSIDFEPIKVPINRPPRFFIKHASRFRGIGYMGDDTERFVQTISFGIGNAKAYGLGFLMYKTVE